jgi:2-polyprenyl-6-methoxyphenol hydroxylase-like FAD-dependent oxidoreductase
LSRAVFGELGKGLSPYPYALIFPQDAHEKLLKERLAAAGLKVERQTELLRFEDSAGGVQAWLRLPDGSEETCSAAYIAGCDGAHSAVRAALGIGFPGGVYNHLFYVADVEANGEVLNGELHVELDTSDFLIVFPLKGEGRARLVGTVKDDAGHPRDDLSWDDVGKSVIASMKIDVEQVNWFSTYRVHHRVANRFRGGRAFLLGDAAHIHSPVGGQGMNTGIGDAVNLAWKLAAVLRGVAPASLLDSYEPERIAFARQLVATTDRAFTEVTSNGAMARLVRLRIVPLLMPVAFRFAAFRRVMFRTVSQTAVNYRESTLSEGHAGAVHGGDRLPWVAGKDGGPDNFASMAAMDWQVHVYGDAAEETRTSFEQRRLPLHVFSWSPEMGRAGLRRNAFYLLRPDGYVAIADSSGRAEAIQSYLDARGLKFF